MAKRKPIRMCTDRLLTPGQLKRVAKLAVKIDPGNVALGVDQVVADGTLLPISAASLYAKKWRVGQEITVGFFGGTAAQRKLVRDTVEREIAPHVNLKFVWVDDPTKALIRVAFNPGSAWAYIGIDALGIPKTQPTMNLGWLTGGVIEHEFLHALGCIHEHQHPMAQIDWNKPAVYAFYAGPPNYWSQSKTQLNVIDKYSTEVTQYSVFDPTSVLMYAIDRSLVTDPSDVVGWNEKMSDIDREFIASQYPFPVAPPPTKVRVTIDKPGTYELVEA